MTAAWYKDMGKLLLLLLAAFCLQAEAVIKYWYFLDGSTSLTWDRARTQCEDNHIDLATMEDMDENWLADWMSHVGVRQVWLGLRRDPQDNAAWRWINVRTGVGMMEDDLASNGYWSGDEHRRGYCAAISGQGPKWSSLQCSDDMNFYCSGASIRHDSNTEDWATARQKCQSDSMVLAIVTEENADQFVKDGWIGLRRQGGDIWSWANPNQQFNYTNWAEGEPLTEDCGFFDGNDKKWMPDSCSKEKGFLCLGDNLLVVKENKTWEEALKHCRNLGIYCSTEPCSDLLTLTEDHEHAYVRDRVSRAKTTEEVWIGLHFTAGDWWGANGKSLNHKMSPDCPSPQNRCGIVSRNKPSNWDTSDCGEKKHFVCILDLE